MIQVTKCPFRISLAGGSTDLQKYLEQYGEGAVISFTPNLFTYIIMKKSSDDHYKIIYSNVERVAKTKDIKNDIAREVLTYFNMPPIEVIFTADIPSSGSGLASSSSYMVNLIKACLQFQGKEMTSTAIGELAITLERKFNPLTGYQDIWGCLLNGFKLLKFNKDGLLSNQKLTAGVFDRYDFYLIPTDATRSSTSILETIDYSQVHKMSLTTMLMWDAINDNGYDRIKHLINSGWEQKKLTSPSIINEQISAIENTLRITSSVAAWRLIGAGNGGYFLVLTEKNSYLPLKNIKINLHDE
jgi:D-glycero-alpha-D-manno-heptose-7-phosphate kinase